MSRDFEQIPGILSLVTGKVGDEPTFTFPEVLEAINLCSANLIAVLGVELFLVKPDGYYATGCSDYDIQLTHRWPSVSAANWTKYVKENNELARESIHRNSTGDDHVYVLTTASWMEHCKIQGSKHA